MFVWALSSKEAFCKKPQLKQGLPEIRKWLVFEKSAVSGRLSQCVSAQRLFSGFFLKEKIYFFYVQKFLVKTFFV